VENHTSQVENRQLNSRRPDRPEWLATLAIGNAGEVAVANLLKSIGIAVRKSRDFSTDLEFVAGKIEVKNDVKALSSGYAAIETGYRGRPSGVNTSCATTWVYVVGSEIILVALSALRRGVADLPERRGGENATIKLLPLDTLRRIGISVRGGR